jgi:hypothetical protein
MDLDHLEEFPQGLGEVYHQFFERQFGINLAYYREEIRFSFLDNKSPVPWGYSLVKQSAYRKG